MTPVTSEVLYREMSSERPPVLVEALGVAYYDDAHLPGAINIPADQVDRLAPGSLPDLGADIVVYCCGTCSSSRIVADRLAALGYERVRLYVGGKEDWVEQGLPVERTPCPT